MPLSENQRQKIANLLSQKIENKLEKYGKETTSMPFLARLIQDSEKIAAYSFIHSMATTLGMSVYEEVSEIIAVENSEKAHKKYGMGWGDFAATKRSNQRHYNRVEKWFANG